MLRLVADVIDDAIVVFTVVVPTVVADVVVHDDAHVVANADARDAARLAASALRSLQNKNALNHNAQREHSIARS